MNYRSKQTLMQVGAILLIVALVAALFIFLGDKKTDDDYKRVSAKWSVGGIDETGVFDKNQDTAMTSDFIEIEEGLKFELKENKKVTYTVYFYNESKNLIAESSMTFNDNKTLTLTEINENLEGAKYVRVVMTGMAEDDNHIDIFERARYSGYLNIFVTDEDQSKE